jgi:hypothetical protein
VKFRTILVSPSKVKTFFCLPIRDKLWFCLVYPLSGLVRLAILTIPFRFYNRLLGHHYKNHQLSVVVDESQQQLARHIGRIVRVACRYTPWESKCLVQAILARLWLRWYGIPYVLYLGLAKGMEDLEPLKAHAWVCVGPWVVTGRQGHSAYTIISTFIAPGRLGR